MRPLALALIGCGAIGSAVLYRLRSDPVVRIVGVVARSSGHPGSVATLQRLGIEAPVVANLEELRERPDLCLECAGHAALATHVVPALRAGTGCIVVSVGALAAEGMAEAIEAAAIAGSTRVELIAGAIGAIDALAAAREGGLDEVVYTGIKPAASWAGAAGVDAIDLAGLLEPAVIFEGSARDAARAYPKNANVAATVALAGLGLDRTRARLVADPHAASNVHQLRVNGAFGRFDFTIEGRPSPDNPRTSALTAWSAVRAVRNHIRPIAI